MITIENKQRSFIIYGIAIVLLMIPVVGMQFSSEVSWSGFDFMIASVLLFGAAFTIDLILRILKKKSQRIILTISVLTIFFLIWAELAVGLFGTPFARN